MSDDDIETLRDFINAELRAPGHGVFASIAKRNANEALNALGRVAARLEHNAELMKALADSTKDEFSMARRLRAGIVEARRHLAKGRTLWNGPCIQCDGVLEAALKADASTTDEYSAARLESLMREPVRMENAPK